MPLKRYPVPGPAFRPDRGSLSRPAWIGGQTATLTPHPVTEVQGSMAGNIRRLRLIFALAAVCALTAAGCGTRQEPAPGPRAQEIPAREAEFTETDLRDPAARLEALAKSVAGVRDANCVVFGGYAIVGVDVEEHLDRSRVGTIKYSVAEALRKDPDGARAVVTADIDLAQRIREIRDDIRQGRPVAGFAEELADIIGRLVPQFPGSVVPRKDPQQAQQENDGSGASSQSDAHGAGPQTKRGASQE